MENEKLFEFMEKMYSEMTSRMDTMHDEMRNMRKDMDKGFKKLDIEVEEIKTDIQQLSEIQDNQRQANGRHHAEIVEMLTERLDTQDKAIKNITLVK